MFKIDFMKNIVFILILLIQYFSIQIRTALYIKIIYFLDANMQDDDWDEISMNSSTVVKQPNLQSRILQPNSLISSPFVNIIRIEAYFQQTLKVQGSQQPQKISKVQYGSGFLVGKTKILTSASLLYSSETKTQASYVMLYSEHSEIQTPKKGIKPKNIYFNELYSFHEPFNKFYNNFAIIFAEENLIQSENWLPFQFDWSYDEDYQSKENVSIAAYRWKQSDKTFEKVFKQFKPEEKEKGVFKTFTKTLKGEEGSPLIIREKDPKDKTKIIYKVVGILTKSSDSKTNAIEFGYLVEDRQILKKQTKTLGAEVLFSIQSSNAYQDLKNQKQKSGSQIKESKIQNDRQQGNTSNDVALTMKSSLEQKTRRIIELEEQVRLFKSQVTSIKDQNCLNKVETEQLNQLKTIIFTLREENAILNRKVSEMTVVAEQLEMEKRNVSREKEKQRELAVQIERLKAEIVAKNIQLTQKAIQIIRLEDKEFNPMRWPSQTPSTSYMNPQTTPQSSSQGRSQTNYSGQSSQISNPSLIEEFSSKIKYLNLAFDTQEQAKKRYHKHDQRQIQTAQNQLDLSLDRQGYSLDHSKMLFYVQNFVDQEWNKLQMLDLSQSGLDNAAWNYFWVFGYIMPKLKILNLKDNEVEKIRPQDLDPFGSLRVLILDSTKFTQLQKGYFKIYQRQRGNLKIIFK